MVWLVDSGDLALQVCIAISYGVDTITCYRNGKKFLTTKKANAPLPRCQLTFPVRLVLVWNAQTLQRYNDGRVQFVFGCRHTTGAPSNIYLCKSANSFVPRFEFAHCCSVRVGFSRL
jgi:hypothetical protein